MLEESWGRRHRSLLYLLTVATVALKGDLGAKNGLFPSYGLQGFGWSWGFAWGAEGGEAG